VTVGLINHLCAIPSHPISSHRAGVPVNGHTTLEDLSELPVFDDNPMKPNFRMMDMATVLFQSGMGPDPALAAENASPKKRRNSIGDVVANTPTPTVSRPTKMMDRRGSAPVAISGTNS
jgi:hypothetical protein